MARYRLMNRASCVWAESGWYWIIDVRTGPVNCLVLGHWPPSERLTAFNKGLLSAVPWELPLHNSWGLFLWGWGLVSVSTSHKGRREEWRDRMAKCDTCQLFMWSMAWSIPSWRGLIWPIWLNYIKHWLWTAEDRMTLSVFLFFYLHSECLNLNPSGGIKILSSYTYCHKEDKIRIKTLMKMQWTRTHTQTDRCVISSDCVVRRLCDIPRAKNGHWWHPQSLCIEQNNGSFKHRTQTDEHCLH